MEDISKERALRHLLLQFALRKDNLLPVMEMKKISFRQLDELDRSGLVRREGSGFPILFASYRLTVLGKQILKELDYIVLPPGEPHSDLR
jgi:DNA-binding HxlR family transcriptional regulator